MPRLIPILRLTLLFFVAAQAGMAGAFQPRTAQERAEALGDLAEAPAELRPFLAPDADFDLIPLPQPHDWLAVHTEPGQTFAEFLRARPNRIDATRRVLYLLPLGDFGPNGSPSLEKVRRYAAVFFQMEVRVLPAYVPDTMEFEPRVNEQSRQLQMLTTSILAFLKSRLPEDAFCLLGITMQDLYPKPSWNYVFGQASLRERVGVYSFARYDPDFFGEERPEDHRNLVLRRSCKVLAHETAHMFGLRHCIYYDCALNGSNHLAESDARTLQLCPICLRKLQHGTAFDPARRYAELARFYREQGWAGEAEWCERQLAKAGGAATAAP